MSSEPKEEGRNTRSLVLSGIAWNTIFQVFGIGLNFAVMLFSVRLISPAEFGKFATVSGILALVNVLNCEAIVSHAVQLQDHQEPAWDVYWSLAVRQQFLLFGFCNIVAGCLWALPTYREVAPLLHLASLGLIWDSAARLRATMLRRDLNFLRLRLLGVACNLASALVTIIMALVGFGAIALVMGGYVVLSLPRVIEFFWVYRDKPLKGWSSSLQHDSLRSILSFGFHQATVGALAMARGALEAAVIPGVIGYAGFGLWNRAQVLFQTSSGRAVGIIAETAYPVLPRSSGDAKRYRRYATLFTQIVVAIAIFGAFYVGTNGILLSRVLYGAKWVDADVLILPATIFGLGSVLSLASGDVLLAANRLRKRFVAISLQAIAAFFGIAILVFRSQINYYGWAAATLQLLAGFVSLLLASEHFERDWLRRVWLIPITGAIAGTAAVLLFQWMVNLPVGKQLVINTAVYALVAGLVLRFCFPAFVRDSLKVVPKGENISLILGLSVAER